MASSTVDIIIRAQDQASRSLEAVRKQLDALDKQNKGLRETLNKVAIAGGAVVASLGLMVRGAEGERKTIQQLAAAVDRAGGSWANMGASIEQAISGLQGVTGIADELQRTALAQLIDQLGDAEIALQALPLAMDVAASTGRDLNSVVQSIGPALAGVTNRIRGTSIEFAAGMAPAERIQLALEAVGGTAEAMATPLDRLRVSWGDMSDAIGGALLPAVDSLATALNGLVQAFIGLPEPVQQTIAILGASGGLAAVVSPLLLMLPSLSVAIRGVGAALAFLALNPVGATITAIGALTAGLLWWLSDEEAAVEAGISAAGEAASGLGSAAGFAAEEIAKIPPELNKLQVSFDAFLSGAQDVEALFRQRFGEIPQAVAESLAQVQAVIQEQSGVLNEPFAEALVQMTASARDVLGIKLPEEVSNAIQVLHSAWTTGPQQVLEEGVADAVEALDSLPAETQEALATTAAILTETWEPTQDIIARPIELAADRAIAAFDMIAPAAVAAAQAAGGAFGSFGLGEGQAIFSGVPIGQPQTIEQVQAAIAQVQAQMQAILAQNPAAQFSGIGGLGPANLGESAFQSAESQLAQLLALLAQLQGGGVPGFASGTDFAPGGFAMVGERGPELVNLPRGSQVVPNQAMGKSFVNYGSITVVNDAGASLYDLPDML